MKRGKPVPQDIRNFIVEARRQDNDLSSADIAAQVARQFPGQTVDKSTILRILKSKKAEEQGEALRVSALQEHHMDLKEVAGKLKDALWALYGPPDDSLDIKVVLAKWWNLGVACEIDKAGRKVVLTHHPQGEYSRQFSALREHLKSGTPAVDNDLTGFMQEFPHFIAFHVFGPNWDDLSLDYDCSKCCAYIPKVIEGLRAWQVKHPLSGKCLLCPP